MWPVDGFCSSPNQAAKRFVLTSSRWVFHVIYIGMNGQKKRLHCMYKTLCMISYIHTYVYICLKDKKSAPLNHQSSKYHTYTANIFIQSAVEVQLNDCKLCSYCICGIHWMQCRHYRFLAGKDAIVAATLPACRHCCHCFLFLKIQPRTKPWLPCLLWRPWSKSTWKIGS